LKFETLAAGTNPTKPEFFFSDVLVLVCHLCMQEVSRAIMLIPLTQLDFNCCTILLVLAANLFDAKHRTNKWARDCTRATPLRMSPTDSLYLMAMLNRIRGN